MKVELGSVNSLYPLPTTLIGATVNGKPNYIAIAWVGIVGRNNISLCMNKRHYSNSGIIENKTFSVNIPSIDLVKETDYCGLKSGKDTDKASLFKSFYGKLETAPMIEECPINIECRLVNTVDTLTHDVFIGEIETTYCDESILDEGKVDLSRVQPILFSMLDRGYWKLGERFATAYDIGKELM